MTLKQELKGEGALQPSGMTESVPEPNWPKDKIERLVALRNEAKSSGTIAKIMGITRNAVIGKLSRMKLKSLNYRTGCKANTEPQAQPRGIPSVAAIMATVRRKPYGSGKKPVQAITHPPKLKTRPRLTPAPANGILISGLESGQCKFAVGTDKAGNHIFCGAATDGGSWCDAHRIRVYQCKS